MAKTELENVMQLKRNVEDLLTELLNTNDGSAEWSELNIGRSIQPLIRKLKAYTISDLVAKMWEWKSDEIAKAADIGDEEAMSIRQSFIYDQHELTIALTDGITSISELNVRLSELFSDDAEHHAVMRSTVHWANGLETDKAAI